MLSRHSLRRDWTLSQYRTHKARDTQRDTSRMMTVILEEEARADDHREEDDCDPELWVFDEIKHCIPPSIPQYTPYLVWIVPSYRHRLAHTQSVHVTSAGSLSVLPLTHYSRVPLLYSDSHEAQLGRAPLCMTPQSVHCLSG